MADRQPVRVWLSLGSNIDPQWHIPQALTDLQDCFGELVVSSTYESEAVGCAGDNFHNLVVGVLTTLPVDRLANQLRSIEQKHGRRRTINKFAARTLDIDLLTYGDLVVNEADMQLPRDEVTRYAFVLLPLAEVAGEEIHPLSGLTYRQLWEQFDDSGQSLWRIP